MLKCLLTTARSLRKCEKCRKQLLFLSLETVLLDDDMVKLALV